MELARRLDLNRSNIRDCVNVAEATTSLQDFGSSLFHGDALAMDPDVYEIAVHSRAGSTTVSIRSGSTQIDVVKRLDNFAEQSGPASERLALELGDAQGSRRRRVRRSNRVRIFRRAHVPH